MFAYIYILTGELLVIQRTARPVADLAHTVALAERLVWHIAERISQRARTPAILVRLQRWHLECRKLAALSAIDSGSTVCIYCHDIGGHRGRRLCLDYVHFACRLVGILVGVEQEVLFGCGGRNKTRIWGDVTSGLCGHVERNFSGFGCCCCD